MSGRFRDHFERRLELLAALGWKAVLRREDYLGRRPWTLMEKRFPIGD